MSVSLPSAIAWYIAWTAANPETLLPILILGIAATPQRSTPAAMRAMAPSFRLPAGTPACAFEPAR